MKVFYSFVFFCIICICSCTVRNPNTTDKNADSVATMKMATDSNNITSSIDSSHEVKSLPDWAGTYKAANMPCEDCEGIAAKLTLKSDSTYMLSQKHHNGSSVKEVDSQGKFVWINNSIIELKETKGEYSKYKVDKKYVVELDNDGKVTEGIHAKQYILEKE